MVGAVLLETSKPPKTRNKIEKKQIFMKNSIFPGSLTGAQFGVPRGALGLPNLPWDPGSYGSLGLPMGPQGFPSHGTRDLLVNLEKLGFSQKLFFSLF